MLFSPLPWRLIRVLWLWGWGEVKCIHRILLYWLYTALATCSISKSRQPREVSFHETTDNRTYTLGALVPKNHPQQSQNMQDFGNSWEIILRFKRRHPFCVAVKYYNCRHRWTDDRSTSLPAFQVSRFRTCTSTRAREHAPSWLPRYK